MEQITPIVSPIINAVVANIEKKLDEIKEQKREDIQVSKKYIEIAKLAIEGLGKEVQDIINSARTLNFKDKHEVKKLKDRINGYLYSDNLRTLLNKEALPGLEVMLDTLSKKANARNLFLKKNQEKGVVVESLTKLIQDLKNYIEELQNNYFWEYKISEDSKLSSGGSGMLMYDLKKIMDIIEKDDMPSNKHKELKNFFEESEDIRSDIYNNWQVLMGKFTKTYEQIRTQFR